MRRFARTAVVLASLALILAVSGAALARHIEEGADPIGDADMIFNFGYDDVNQQLLVGWFPSGDEADCAFGDETVEITYGDDGTGVAGECEIQVGSVAGPAGQVNHGQVMKALKDILPSGYGCLSRWVAQSDLGKGDQQIRTPDLGDDLASSDLGLVQFTAEMATCGHKHHDPEGIAPDEGTRETGKPDSPGKSGDAPGQSQESTLQGEDATEPGRPDSPGKSGDAPGKNK